MGFKFVPSSFNKQKIEVIIVLSTKLTFALALWIDVTHLQQIPVREAPPRLAPRHLCDQPVGRPTLVEPLYKVTHAPPPAHLYSSHEEIRESN